MKESELFIKYKSSYGTAVCDLSVHMFLICSSVYALWYFRNSWVSILTIPFTAGMINRTFIVFHDCGHNSYMPNAILNYILGNILGVFVFTPFSWSWHHGNHHKTSGNIRNKLKHKYNETIYHTLFQYSQWGWCKRLLYNIVRYPFIFYSVVPVIYFGIKQRVDVMRYKINASERYSQSTVAIVFETLLSNVSISTFVYGLYMCNLLIHYCIAMYIFGIIALCVFHNQHTFNPSYITDNDNWTQRNSGLLGSSLIQLPWVFKYFFMGIEYHHIHHMNAKIPGYNLQAYHEEVVSKSDLFDNVVKLSMSDFFNNLWLVLYDEDNQRYITFAQADEEIRKKYTQ
jgi:omega-6 fatty acid desaturase (delta-12 desaturase)